MLLRVCKAGPHAGLASELEAVIRVASKVLIIRNEVVHSVAFLSEDQLVLHNAKKSSRTLITTELIAEKVNAARKHADKCIELARAVQVAIHGT